MFPPFVATLDANGTFRAITLRSFKSKKNGNEGLPKIINAGEVLTVLSVFKKSDSRKANPYRWKVRNADGLEGVIAPKWMIVIRPPSYHGLPPQGEGEGDSAREEVLFRLCCQRPSSSEEEAASPLRFKTHEVLNVVGYVDGKEGPHWSVVASNGSRVPTNADYSYI